MGKIAEDPRIDPRIKAALGALDFASARGDAVSRDQLLEEANTEEAIELRGLVTAFQGMCDTEEIAPSKGLTTITTSRTRRTSMTGRRRGWRAAASTCLSTPTSCRC